MSDALKKKRFENSWAIVVSDYNKARRLMLKIGYSYDKDIIRILEGKNELRMEFSDGTVLRWFDPSRSGCAYKFGKMWCERNIDKDILSCVILPCYCGKCDDITWV